mgnify:CR=1 FL=1
MRTDRNNGWSVHRETERQRDRETERERQRDSLLVLGPAGWFHRAASREVAIISLLPFLSPSFLFSCLAGTDRQTDRQTVGLKSFDEAPEKHYRIKTKEKADRNLRLCFFDPPSPSETFLRQNQEEGRTKKGRKNLSLFFWSTIAVRGHSQICVFSLRSASFYRIWFREIIWSIPSKTVIWVFQGFSAHSFVSLLSFIYRLRLLHSPLFSFTLSSSSFFFFFFFSHHQGRRHISLLILHRLSFFLSSSSYWCLIVIFVLCSFFHPSSPLLVDSIDLHNFHNQILVFDWISES